jgi:multidrug efflux pump subunit AcrB
MVMAFPQKCRPYRRLLTAALRHRFLTLALAVGIFFGSLQLVPYIPTSLFETSDTGLSTISVELPPGSTLADTQAATDQLAEGLLADAAVSTVLTTEGGDEGVNTATAYVRLVPKRERDVSQKQFEQNARDIFRTIPGARISFRSAGASGEGKDLTIVLKGDDPVALRQASDDLARQMRDIPGMVDVSSSASLVKPEVLIIPDVDRSTDLGVTVQSIAATASLATLGDTTLTWPSLTWATGKFPFGSRSIPFIAMTSVCSPPCKCPATRGIWCLFLLWPMCSIGTGPAQINRYDRARQISIGGNLQGITLGQA